MLIQFIFIVLFHAITATKEKEYYDVDNHEIVKNLFEDFLQKHNKSYTHFEKANRLNIFHETLKGINLLNKNHPLTVFGITFFTDLTREEMKKYKGFRPNPGFQGSCTTQGDLPSHDAPPSLDWRDKGIVSPVRDQAQCGSCWAFSATAAVESQYTIKTGQQIDLSEQQLVDCDNTSRGCHGGYPTEAFSNLMDVGGQEQESDYPYHAQDGTCQFDSSKAAVKLTNCNSFSLSSEDALKEALAKTGPISIIVDAGPYQSYSNGILTSCTLNESDHAVLLVGYGSEGGTDYWIIKNSWGTGWGENGFIRVQRGVNCNGMLNIYMCTATVAVQSVSMSDKAAHSTIFSIN